MPDYIVSARKYRPTTFSSVVGQGSIATTLMNAIRSGKLAHAYLFCGPRGVGKTTCARIFAKTINCLSPKPDGEACGECESCRAFDEGRSMNIHELDAASNNSVDDIRELTDQVLVPPQIGKYKVFIIDEVHMLSTQAFNAFLKTLEEPPAHAIFILATTEKHKILPTILSRCQTYDFMRMNVADIVQHLAHVAQQEGITAEPAALNIIAQKADGGMRDALSIFDQMVSSTNGNITFQQVIQNLNVLDYDYYFRLVDHLLAKQVSESMLLFNEVLTKGFEGGPFISGLASHLRDVLVCKDPQTAQLLETTDEIRQRYVQQASRVKAGWLYSALRICNNCSQAYRTSQNKRLQVELALIECAQLDDDGSSAGRRPVQTLKPIFAHLSAAAQAGAGSQPAARPAATAPAATAQPQQPAHTTPAYATQPASNTGRAPQTGTSPAGTYATTPNGGTDSQRGAAIPTIKLGMLGGPRIHRKPATPTSAATQTSAATTPSSLAPTAAAPAEATAAPLPDLPLQQDQVLVGWQKYIYTLPREYTAMAQRMRAMQPKLLNEHQLEVIAENQEVSQQVHAMMPGILAFLRRELQNSKVEVVVKVPELTDESHIFDKCAHLQHLYDTHSAMARLNELFQLELE